MPDPRNNLIPEISVVIATYNGEKFLAEQLESLLNQTVPPLELVVCDDRSTDATVSIISSYIPKMPFPVFLYINEDRLGYSQNFYRAVGLAKGEYIAFCDQDDIWNTAKIDIVTRVLASTPRQAQLVLHPSKVCCSDGTSNTKIFPNHFVRQGVYSCFEMDMFATVPGHCIVAKKRLVTMAMHFSHLLPGNSPVATGHDDLVYFLGCVTGISYVLTAPLVSWRQHSQNTCGVPANITSTELTMAISHSKAMFAMSQRWMSLSEALSKLANQEDYGCFNALMISSKYFLSRGKYFALRSKLSDQRYPITSRIESFFLAHFFFSQTSGLGLPMRIRAAFRDICSLTLSDDSLSRIIALVK